MPGEGQITWQTVQLKRTARPGKEGFDDGDWIEAPYITDSGIRLLQTGNIGIGEFLDKSSNRKFISQRSFDELRCKWVHPGDVLICRLADPIGRACRVPDEVGPSVTAVDCTIYRTDPTVADSGFMLHKLNSRAQLAVAGDVAGGSTRQRISRGNLGALEFQLPPLPEQRRIAEILDTLDEAIRKTEQVIKKLQQMKQGLLHDLLTRGIDEHGQLRDPQRHPEQFKDSPLGRIPKEWDVAPFETFASPQRPFLKTGPFGSSLKGEHWVDEGVPVITIGALGEGRFTESELLFISEQKARELAAYAVQPGDIVFSRVADVGRSVVVKEPQRDWVMSSNLMWISLDHERVEPEFVWLNLSGNIRVRNQVRRSVNAGGREVANGGILRSLRLAWPNKAEQAAIRSTAKAWQERVEEEERGLSKLRTLKQGLMDDLLTGRVRVNVAEATT